MSRYDGFLGREESYLEQLAENEYRQAMKRHGTPREKPEPVDPPDLEKGRELLKAALTEEAAVYGQTCEEYLYYLKMRHIPWPWVPKYKGPRLETEAVDAAD